jgi:hypothetical protein
MTRKPLTQARAEVKAMGKTPLASAEVTSVLFLKTYPKDKSPFGN